MIYLDSSAIVKLARREAHTDALRAWIAANAQPVCSSALARTEAARALARNEPAALAVLPSVLATLHQWPVSDRVLDDAAVLPGSTLRSLDAVHLATAVQMRSVLNWFVAYDKRLVDAALTSGLQAVTPE